MLLLHKSLIAWHHLIYSQVVGKSTHAATSAHELLFVCSFLILGLVLNLLQLLLVILLLLKILLRYLS